jgi:hypothetical protein
MSVPCCDIAWGNYRRIWHSERPDTISHCLDTTQSASHLVPDYLTENLMELFFSDRLRSVTSMIHLMLKLHFTSKVLTTNRKQCDFITISCSRAMWFFFQGSVINRNWQKLIFCVHPILYPHELLISINYTHWFIQKTLQDLLMTLKLNIKLLVLYSNRNNT